MDEELLAALDLEPPCDVRGCEAPVHWVGVPSCCGQTVTFRCDEHRRRLDAQFVGGGTVEGECGGLARRVRWDVYGSVEHG